MIGNEFLRRINRLGRQRGSHGTLHYGSRKTTPKDLRKEISTGLLHAMLGQLGLSRRDLDE